MTTEKISSKWLFCILFVSTTSASMIIGYPSESEQDTWIALILSLALGILTCLLYARMIIIMPGKHIYAMAEHALGKVPGKIVSVLFTFYALISFILTIFSYSGFVHMTSLHQTDLFLIIFLYFATILYLAKSGIKTMSKWCAALLFAWIVLTLVYTVISMPKIDINNLLPIFNHSPGDILTSTMKVSILPAGELVLTLGIANHIDSRAKVKKIFVLTAISLFGYMMIVFLRTCALLGAETMSSVLFQNYRAMSVVKISDFFERVEAILAAVYILSGIAKGAIVLSSLTNGVVSIANMKNCRELLVPVAFFALTFTVTPFKGLTDLYDFVEVFYFPFAALFQIIIPILIWIPAEIRHRKNKQNNPVEKLEAEIEALEQQTKIDLSKHAKNHS